jgi:hypothetical protein
MEWKTPGIRWVMGTRPPPTFPSFAVTGQKEVILEGLRTSDTLWVTSSPELRGLGDHCKSWK